MKCHKCGTDNDEAFRFCGNCGAPLFSSPTSNIESAKSLSERSALGGSESGHTKLLNLTCPSCGASLELPDTLTVAHCIHCGTKILLDQDGVARERRDLQRFIELCRVSVEAKNHDEVIQYCNRILEIDIKNIEAWINKAISTFWLTTATHNRYDEAMEYLTEASKIAPDDERTENARKELAEQQALWYNYLGNQSGELAQKVYNIYYDGFPGGDAKQNSAEHAIKAMEYYLVASDYAPDNISVLKNIKNIAEFWDTVKWNEKVNSRIKSLHMLIAKVNAAVTVTKLKDQLQKAESDLPKLQGQTGFLAGIHRDAALSRIAQLRREIANLEKDYAHR